MGFYFPVKPFKIEFKFFSAWLMTVWYLISLSVITFNRTCKISGYQNTRPALGMKCRFAAIQMQVEAWCVVPLLSARSPPQWIPPICNQIVIYVAIFPKRTADECWYAYIYRGGIEEKPARSLVLSSPLWKRAAVAATRPLLCSLHRFIKRETWPSFLKLSETHSRSKRERRMQKCCCGGVLNWTISPS